MADPRKNLNVAGGLWQTGIGAPSKQISDSESTRLGASLSRRQIDRAQAAGDPGVPQSQPLVELQALVFPDTPVGMQPAMGAGGVGVGTGIVLGGPAAGLRGGVNRLALGNVVQSGVPAWTTGGSSRGGAAPVFGNLRPLSPAGMVSVCVPIWLQYGAGLANLGFLDLTAIEEAVKALHLKCIVLGYLAQRGTESGLPETAGACKSALRIVDKARRALDGGPRLTLAEWEDCFQPVIEQWLVLVKTLRAKRNTGGRLSQPDCVPLAKQILVCIRKSDETNILARMLAAFLNEESDADAETQEWGLQTALDQVPHEGAPK